MVRKAVWSGQGGRTSTTSNDVDVGSSSLNRVTKKSVYAEQDSDVDMYEYESDYEDDYESVQGNRKLRGRSNNGPRSTKEGRSKEDISSKAIEQAFTLPENGHDFNCTFPYLKIVTNCGKFSLLQDWSCRHIQEDLNKSTGCGSCGGGQKEEDKKHSAAEDEMLLLLQMQQEKDSVTSVRRSSRSRHAPRNYTDEEEFFKLPPTSMNVTQTSIPGIEYFLLNGDIFHNKDKTIPTTCRSRLGAEGIQEVIHERFFAKLYHENFLNVVVLDSTIGKYENKSFPPYLGHIVPSGEAMVWEIREQYFVPALRWVLRGLVKVCVVPHSCCIPLFFPK